MVFDGLRNDIRIVLVSSPPALLSLNFGPSSPCWGRFFWQTSLLSSRSWNVKTQPRLATAACVKYRLALPEDPADGLVILDLAREIVVTFLQAESTGARERCSGNAYSAAPNLRASYGPPVHAGRLLQLD
jgi:hypothetical protein